MIDMVNIDITQDRVIINFSPMLGRTSRIEAGLVTEDLRAERPVRNLVDTELDDIISEIGELQTMDPKRYEEAMEHIVMARALNNIVKTIELSISMEMTGISYTLLAP